MRITDIDGREREVLFIERVSHSHMDINGEAISEDYVRAIVKGKNRTWINWYPIREFMRRNPSIQV